MHDPSPAATPPWWKFWHLWMVLALPAVVIIASLITLYLALSRPDELVSADYYRQGIEINKSLEDRAAAASLAPALQARNHAATGVVAPSGPVSNHN